MPNETLTFFLSWIIIIIHTLVLTIQSDKHVEIRVILYDTRSPLIRWHFCFLGIFYFIFSFECDSQIETTNVRLELHHSFSIRFFFLLYLLKTITFLHFVTKYDPSTLYRGFQSWQHFALLPYSRCINIIIVAKRLSKNVSIKHRLGLF